MSFGEQVYGVVAGDRKNLVNQYSDQKVKYNLDIIYKKKIEKVAKIRFNSSSLANY